MPARDDGAMAPRVTIPTIEVEFGLELGADFVLRSSRYGLPGQTEDDVGHGPAVRGRIGLAFPEDWIAVWLTGDLVSGSFHGERVLARSNVTSEGGWRAGVSLELEIRPQTEGWVPFGRAFMGASRLGSRDEGPNSVGCSRDGFSCEGPPLANLAYFGVSAGAGLGIAFQGLVEGRLGGLTFEMRYTISEWQSARFEDEHGQQTTAVRVEGRRARLGGGPSAVLHQVGLLVGVRIGWVDRNPGSTISSPEIETKRRRSGSSSPDLSY